MKPSMPLFRMLCQELFFLPAGVSDGTRNRLLKIRRPFLFSVLSLVFVFANTSTQGQKAAPPAVVTKKTQGSYTYKIIDAANRTFGYDIYKNGKLTIHQPSVPAMPDNEGFKTRDASERVARLVIEKMARGESLPTISPKELKKLKAI